MSSARARRAALLGGALAIASACANPTPTPTADGPAPASAAEIGGGRAAPSPAVPAPTRPPAAQGRYGVEPAFDPTELERAALEAVRQRGGKGTGRARPSRALALAARELAEGAASGAADPLSRRRVRAALAGALAFDPAPAAHLVEAAVADAPRAVAEAVGSTGNATHAGAGAAVRGGRAFVVVLLARRTARLEPFPREVARGEAAPLRGELLGLDAPAVHVTSPAGDSRPVELRSRAGRAFAAEVRFDTPGRWTVEVTGEGARGPEVAALIVVACGGAPLREQAAAPPEVDPADPREAERRVEDAIAALRRERGLPALDPWPALSEVARRHSEAMLASGQLAHRLPGSEDAGERLRRARVPYLLVLENVAKGASALEAHRAAEESPAHRRNMLSREATRVGCGVARGTLPGGTPVVYLTELFVRPAGEGSDDRRTAEARVRDALSRERARRGARPLAPDPALDALAREVARDMLRAGEPGTGTLAERALEGGRKVAAADAFVVGSAADVARSRNLGDGRFGRIGIGVVVGDSPRYGAGLLWVAVVYTD